MLEKQNTSNDSKFSKIVEKDFNPFDLRKQPCFDTMLEIGNGSMREYK
jgi:hypothetical protein